MYSGILENIVPKKKLELHKAKLKYGNNFEELTPDICFFRQTVGGEPFIVGEVGPSNAKVMKLLQLERLCCAVTAMWIEKSEKYKGCTHKDPNYKEAILAAFQAAVLYFPMDLSSQISDYLREHSDSVASTPSVTFLHCGHLHKNGKLKVFVAEESVLERIFDGQTELQVEMKSMNTKLNTKLDQCGFVLALLVVILIGCVAFFFISITVKFDALASKFDVVLQNKVSS